MFSPQELKKQTFSKAVFGGYDMQSVDEFIEPLIEDYSTLYRENGELKNKLRVLVHKLEELRDQGLSVSAASKDAEAESATLLQDTKRQCDAMLAEARRQAKQICSDALVEQESQRIECAKQTALNFIHVVETDIRGHLELLEKLKTRDVSAEDLSKFRNAAPAPAPVQNKPYDYEQESPREIASEIDSNLQRMGVTGGEAPAEPAPQPAEEPEEKTEDPKDPTIKFGDLKFGRNYVPDHE